MKTSVSINKKGFLVLRNVRLSFPNLFSKNMSFSDDKENAKYDSAFIMPKSDEESYEIIMDKINEVRSANKLPQNCKSFLRDGDDPDLAKFDGHSNSWIMRASNKHRPTVLNRDKTPLAEEDGVIYSGCYVNAIIELWAQNNKFGKKVNASLLGVQFVKDGERFESMSVASEDDFDDLSANTIDFDDIYGDTQGEGIDHDEFSIPDDVYENAPL